MPATVVETDVIREAVRVACRAPSQHNIQPWRWAFDGDELRLFLDSTRILTSDRGVSEALIGCGAALDHLRVATAAAGLQADVQRFPNPNDLDHLASIRFSPMRFVTEGHRRRAQAIWERHSDRLPLAPPTGWTSFETVLRHAVDRTDVRLDVLSEQARPRLAQASELAESLRLYDSTYHAELQRWTAPFATSEGIPYSALASTGERDRVDIGRVFPAPRHPDRRPGLGEDLSTILVLSTDTDSRAAAFASGEVLSTVLLECTMAGLATCPLTHIIEVRVARDLVESLLGETSVAQILIRVGTAPSTEKPLPRTPRRQVDDVLCIERGGPVRSVSIPG